MPAAKSAEAQRADGSAQGLADLDRAGQRQQHRQRESQVEPEQCAPRYARLGQQSRLLPQQRGPDQRQYAEGNLHQPAEGQQDNGGGQKQKQGGRAREDHRGFRV
jgi:hypothetical protein